ASAHRFNASAAFNCASLTGGGCSRQRRIFSTDTPADPVRARKLAPLILSGRAVSAKHPVARTPNRAASPSLATSTAATVLATSWTLATFLATASATLRASGSIVCEAHLARVRRGKPVLRAASQAFPPQAASTVSALTRCSLVYLTW